jgi:hypothetical protein
MICAAADRGSIGSGTSGETHQSWRCDVMNIRYEIHVQGLLGPVLRTAFADLQCVAVSRFTTIRARMSAEELCSLLDRLDQRGVRFERVYSQPGGGDRQLARGSRAPEPAEPSPRS